MRTVSTAYSGIPSARSTIERLAAVGAGHEMLQHRVEAGANRRLVRSLADAGARPHHLDQRPVADPLAVGRGAALVPPDGFHDAVEVLLELPREPRLADAGLADK